MGPVEIRLKFRHDNDQMAIYLDGHASTPLAPEAIQAMNAIWANQANAASPHAAGIAVAEAIERARSSVAYLIGA